MATVISCSRRTDIPAFYSTWLMNRLRAGYCHTFNPYGKQVYRVPLSPEDVIAMTFWTRNPGPMAKHLGALESSGYAFFFSVTITGYPAPLEPHSPLLQSSLRTFRQFAGRLSPERMRWRYDPIVISSATPVEYHLKRFEELARALQGFTHHCTFSFVQFYGKTARNMGDACRRASIQVEQPDLDAQCTLAVRLAEIAQSYDISLNSCCNDLLAVDGIRKSSCIDPDLIRRVAPARAEGLKKKPTRPDCGCAASVDIGAYDSCLFGCAYCYATSHPSAARRNHAAHDPLDSILYRPEQLRGVDLDAAAVPLKALSA